MWIVTQTVETIDTTELYRKLQGYIDERGQDVEGWIDKATETWETDFNTWFENIKNILSGDVAGALANRILELENKVDNLDLVASKVTMSNGTTVEDNIKSLKDELGTNKSILEANINAIREVL